MKNKMWILLLLFGLCSCGTDISSSTSASSSNDDSFLTSSSGDNSEDPDSSSTGSGNSGTSTSSDTSNNGNTSTSSTPPPTSVSSDTTVPTQKYNVSFVTNCATSLEPLYTNYIAAPPTISNGAMTLEGWYLNSGFTNRVVFPYVVTADVTLYARWVEAINGLNLALTLDNKGYEIVSYYGNAQIIAMPDYHNSKPILSIADYVFYENQTITTVAFPSQLESIGHFAFYGCVQITSLQLPNTLKTIGTSAFQNVKVSTISCGTSLQVIGNSAFQNTELVNITLPNTLREVGAYAFMNCSKLQKIYFSSTTPPLIKYNSFDNTNVDLYVPNAYLSDYKNANVWKDFASQIKGY